MAEREPPKSLRDLDTRLKQLRGEDDAQAREDAARERGQSLSQALRIGVELVASLVVGVGIGLLLDGWLGTAPWLLIVFFILGAAAGMMNVYRVMSGMSQSVGYASDKQAKPDAAEATRDQEGKADRRGKR